nr:MAG TPA: ferredoxin thioredoxin reductase [Bacteriophage sp.]DAI40227.1 MAG TPA: ferredoxin thioredoxin reductase [Caudoviricetes sp.]DAR58971.1 MAG TPA: ferredoxin thioredoxin reductase [Caudoviricetes sp.]
MRHAAPKTLHPRPSGHFLCPCRLPVLPYLYPQKT